MSAELLENRKLSGAAFATSDQSVCMLPAALQTLLTHRLYTLSHTLTHRVKERGTTDGLLKESLIPPFFYSST